MTETKTTAIQTLDPETPLGKVALKELKGLSGKIFLYYCDDDVGQVLIRTADAGKPLELLVLETHKDLKMDFIKGHVPGNVQGLLISNHWGHKWL